MSRALRVRMHAQRLAIARLDPDSPPPAWAGGEFWSCTRSPRMLTVVCPEQGVPAAVEHEPGWVALEVLGPFDFSAVGVVAAIADPLRAAGVSVFVVSAYDTDYVLIKAAQSAAARTALEAAGVAIE